MEDGGRGVSWLAPLCHWMMGAFGWMDGRKEVEPKTARCFVVVDDDDISEKNDYTISISHSFTYEARN